jgi:hypothetical protein
MTGTVLAACFVTGLITGWLLRSVIVMAEASRLQEAMQNKIRYWQSETLHARHRAERLASQLRAVGYPSWDACDESAQYER